MALTQAGIDYICQSFGDTTFCCIDSGLSWYYSIGQDDYQETGGTAQIVGRLVSGLIDSLTMTNPARGTFTQSQLNAANGQSVTLQDAQTIASHDNPAEDQWCFQGGGDECSDYVDKSECLSHGCYWWNNVCHDNVICSAILSQQDCLENGCNWYNGSCHSGPPSSCSELNNQSDCMSYGCYWYDDSCHSEPQGGVCEDINNQSDCLAQGCYWYKMYPWEEEACHTNPQQQFPEIPWTYIALAGAGITIGILAIALLTRRNGKKNGAEYVVVEE